ncbi:MAG: hypothetical protein GC201_00185 [Alphaproteobacteria bacterium]|nr:hypothetical protein [Alphaproteobacteria bacterium]
MNRTAILSVFLGLTALAFPAHATSRVTIANGWNNPVDVAVFDGKERACQLRDANSKGTVAAGASASFSCKGVGTDRCRVTILVPDKNNRYCKELYKNCKDKAVNVDDGGTVTLSGTGATPTCAVGAP